MDKRSSRGRGRWKNLSYFDICLLTVKILTMLTIPLILLIYQVEGDIVELESLMRGNFLVVTDEMQDDEVADDEVQEDSEEG